MNKSQKITVTTTAVFVASVPAFGAFVHYYGDGLGGLAGSGLGLALGLLPFMAVVVLGSTALSLWIFQICAAANAPVVPAAPVEVVTSHAPVSIAHEIAVIGAAQEDRVAA